MAHWRFQSASNSFPLVGTLAAGCRAGSFGERRAAFLLRRGVMDLRVALTLAGPTVWNREKTHRFDSQKYLLPLTRAHGALLVLAGARGYLRQS